MRLTLSGRARNVVVPRCVNGVTGDIIAGFVARLTRHAGADELTDDGTRFSNACRTLQPAFALAPRDSAFHAATFFGFGDHVYHARVFVDARKKLSAATTPALLMSVSNEVMSSIVGTRSERCRKTVASFISGSSRLRLLAVSIR